MDKYKKELQALKTWDKVQCSKDIGRGYQFITTAGHGYLVVPKNDGWASVAAKVCEFGFVGKLAYYLEEDSEAPEFMKLLKD